MHHRGLFLDLATEYCQFSNTHKRAKRHAPPSPPPFDLKGSMSRALSTIEYHWYLLLLNTWRFKYTMVIMWKLGYRLWLYSLLSFCMTCDAFRVLEESAQLTRQTPYPVNDLPAVQIKTQLNSMHGSISSDHLKRLNTA